MRRVIASVVCLVAALSLESREANADSNLTAAQRRTVIDACSAKPNAEICVALKQKCMSFGKVVTGNDLMVCSALGYMPQDHARRQISRLKEDCDENDLDEKCIALRTSCRESNLTCEQVKDWACNNESGPYCDSEFLCTPSRLNSVCSGKSEPGATHMLVHLNYASLGDAAAGGPALDGFIVSGSALSHGMVGDDAVGANYIVDMGLGWLRGDGNNGLAYELQALIGGGFRSGSKLMFGAAIGGGFSGIAVGDIGFGWLVSTEAFAVAELVKGIDLLAFVRPTFVYSETARQDGSDSLSFADELTAGATLTWTSKHREGNFVAGKGYGLSLFMREQVGIRMFGIGLGIATTDASL